MFTIETKANRNKPLEQCTVKKGTMETENTLQNKSPRTQNTQNTEEILTIKCIFL